MRSGTDRLAIPRTRSMIALARSASLTMSPKAPRSSSSFGFALERRPRDALALLAMAPSG